MRPGCGFRRNSEPIYEIPGCAGALACVYRSLVHRSLRAEEADRSAQTLKRAEGGIDGEFHRRAEGLYDGRTFASADIKREFDVAGGPGFARGEVALCADRQRALPVRPHQSALRVASAYAPLYVPVRIAVDEINAAGGILGRKVEIVDGDEEGTPAKEPAVVRALMEQKIDILLGPGMTVDYISANLKDKKIGIIQESFAKAAMETLKDYPGMSGMLSLSPENPILRRVRRELSAIARPE